MSRLHRQSPTVPTTNNLLHRVLLLRRRQHADLPLLRSPLSPNPPHLLLLRCLRQDLQLAAHNHHLTLPPLSRKETKCPSESYRFLRLRSRSVASGDDPVHTSILPATDCGSVLFDICVRQDGNYQFEGCFGYAVGISEPLPPFCPDAESQGFETSTRYILSTAYLISSSPATEFIYLLGGIHFELRTNAGPLFPSPSTT